MSKSQLVLIHLIWSLAASAGPALVTLIELRGKLTNTDKRVFVECRGCLLYILLFLPCEPIRENALPQTGTQDPRVLPHRPWQGTTNKPQPMIPKLAQNGQRNASRFLKREPLQLRKPRPSRRLWSSCTFALTRA